MIEDGDSDLTNLIELLKVVTLNYEVAVQKMGEEENLPASSWVTVPGRRQW